MDPPGAILPLNSTSLGIIPPLSPSSRDDTEGSQSERLHNSDPLQSQTTNTDSIPKISPSDVTAPLITHIDNDDFGPRFKDQTNSVAFGETGDTMRRQAQTTPIIEMHVDDPKAVNKQDNGPSYKDQVNDSSNEVFLTSNRLSHPAATSNNNNNNSSNSLPIVHGVLIPPEMLTDEERRTSGQDVVTNSQPIGSGTYQHTTTTSLDVHASDHRPTPPDGASPKKSSEVSPTSSDEQMFWMKIIFGAIVLNTFLVAAVIVGTFCGIGLCSSGSGSSYDTSANVPVPTFAPRTMSPTTVPTLAPLPLLTLTLQPGTTFSPTVASSSTGTVAAPTIPPSVSPSFAPSTIPIAEKPPTQTDANKRPNVVVFIIPAVILEFIFVLTCLYYYYQRKKKRLQKTKSEYLSVESGNLESNIDA